MVTLTDTRLRFIASDHAASRYQQRVKPAFSTAQAHDELRRLASQFGGPELERPPSWAGQTTEPDRTYMEVGDDLCLVLASVRDPSSRVIMTVLSRGGLGDVARADRNAFNKRRRRNKRTRRESRRR